MAIESFITAVPYPENNFPDLENPLKKIPWAKGRQRLAELAGNGVRTIQSKSKAMAEFVLDTAQSVVTEKRAFSLMMVGTGLRLGLGSFLNLDMHTTDVAINAFFSLGMTVDKAVIPLVEKLTGLDTRKQPLASKLRGGFEDLLCIAAGSTLGNLADNHFLHTPVVYADEPVQRELNCEFQPEPEDECIDELFDKQGKSFVHHGGVVMSNGSVVFATEGKILSSGTGSLRDFLNNEHYFSLVEPAGPIRMDTDPLINPIPEVDLFGRKTPDLDLDSLKNFSQDKPSWVPSEIPKNIFSPISPAFDDNQITEATPIIDSNLNFDEGTKDGVQYPLAHGEYLPPTQTSMGIVEGSVTDDSLTISGSKWHLMDNLRHQVDQAMHDLGIQGHLNEEEVRELLDNAVHKWATNKLETDSDESLIFHGANGTSSLKIGAKLLIGVLVKNNTLIIDEEDEEYLDN